MGRLEDCTDIRDPNYGKYIYYFKKGRGRDSDLNMMRCLRRSGRGKKVVAKGLLENEPGRLYYAKMHRGKLCGYSAKLKRSKRRSSGRKRRSKSRKKKSKRR